MLCDVDISTGSTLVHSTDLALPGYIPFEVERLYLSTTRSAGLFGYGWSTTLQVSLQIGTTTIAYDGGSGDKTLFPHPPPNGRSQDPTEQMLLEDLPDKYIVYPTPFIMQVFPKAAASKSVIPVHFTQDLNGNRIRFRHDGHGRLTELEDTDRRLILLEYDGEDRISALRLASVDSPTRTDLISRYRYSALGDLIAVIDADGHASTMTYEDHLLVSNTNRLGGTRYAQYDARRRCIAVWNSDGTGHRQIHYTDEGEPATRVVDSLGHQFVYTRSAAGAITKQVYPNGESAEFHYDSNNRLLAVTRASGDTAASSMFDREHRRLVLVDGDGSVLTVHQNARGQAEVVSDSDGTQWKMAYDEAGNLVELETPQASRWHFSRNSRGTVTELVSPEGRRLRKSWDASGRTVNVSDGIGTLYSHSYDLMGRLVGSVRPTGLRQERLYDRLGNLVEVRENGTPVVRYEYDPEGHPVSVHEGPTQVTRLRYDSFGRPIEIGEADGGILRARYDSEGRISQIVNAVGETASFQFDWADRVIKHLTFDGRGERRDYRRGGLEIVRHVPGGTVTLDFNQVGNLVSETGSDGAFRRFSYATGGLLLEAENGEGSIQFQYDAEGNTTTERRGRLAVNYTYDKDGNVIGCIDQSGYGYGIAYDARGRISSVSDQDAHEYTLRYDLADRLLSLRMPGGWTQEFGYDEIGQLSTQRVVDPHGALYRIRSYAYAADGHVDRIEDSQTGWRSYSYDAVGRLLEVRHEHGPNESYTYDLNGNLLSSSSMGAYEYRDGRLASIDGTHYTYDAAGELTHRATAGDDLSLRFNLFGELSDVQRGSRHYRYHYDALERRIARETDGASVDWQWDDGSLWATTGDGPQAHYLVLGDRLLGMTTSEGHYSFLLDQAGTPIDLLGSAGSVWQMQSSTAYGVLTPSSDAHQPFRFLGQTHDPETGLHFNRFRYYDPASGRYISPDPIEEFGGPNLFSFVSDPLLEADPLGLISGRAWAYNVITPQRGRNARNKVHEICVEKGRYPNKEKCWKKTQERLRRQGTYMWYNATPRPEDWTTGEDRIPAAYEIYDAVAPAEGKPCRKKGKEDADHCHDWALGGPHGIENFVTLGKIENSGAGGFLGKKYQSLSGLKHGDFIKLVFKKKCKKK